MGGRAGGVRTLLQPAWTQCLRFSERFFSFELCYKTLPALAIAVNHNKKIGHRTQKHRLLFRLLKYLITHTHAHTSHIHWKPRLELWNLTKERIPDFKLLLLLLLPPPPSPLSIFVKLSYLSEITLSYAGSPKVRPKAKSSGIAGAIIFFVHQTKPKRKCQTSKRNLKHSEASWHTVIFIPS